MLLSRLFFRIIIHCFNFKNGFFNHTNAFIRIFLYIIAPESDYRPSQKKELLVDFIIPLFVSGYFTNPIFTIITLFQSRLKHFPIFAVEKLSIAKNCYFIFSKYNIRLLSSGLLVTSQHHDLLLNHKIYESPMKAC